MDQTIPDCVTTDSPSLPTDRELIDRCLVGEHEAWEQLLDRYGGLIYSIARRTKLPPEDVADVFQSVCLSMWEGLSRLRDENKLSSWVVTITLRQCYRMKRGMLRSALGFGQTQDEISDVADGSNLQDEEIEVLEKERLVRQALTMLPERCQRLLTYLFYEKELWSYKEIAQDLGLAPSAIGATRGRCLRDLLKVLNNLGF